MALLPPRGDATRLVLVRHAEPDPAMRGRCYGSLDVALSAEGRRRAAELGAALAANPLAGVYASPLERAEETATPIAGAQGLGVVTVRDLREIDFGELEGLAFDEIRAGWAELYRQWMERPARVRFPGGESFSDLRDRALPALADIRMRHAGEAVVVVTHGGVVRVALADVLRLDGDASFRFGLDYGGVSVVDWVNGSPVLRVVNADLYSRA
jgi:alpha-ribazole phosphatase